MNKHACIHTLIHPFIDLEWHESKTERDKSKAIREIHLMTSPHSYILNRPTVWQSADGVMLPLLLLLLPPFFFLFSDDILFVVVVIITVTSVCRAYQSFRLQKYFRHMMRALIERDYRSKEHF